MSLISLFSKTKKRKQSLVEINIKLLKLSTLKEPMQYIQPENDIDIEIFCPNKKIKCCLERCENFTEKYNIIHIFKNNSINGVFLVKNYFGKKYICKAKKNNNIENEIEIYNKLKNSNNNNIQKYIDFDTINGINFFIIEYVDGYEINKYCLKYTLNNEDYKNIFINCLINLIDIHNEGIVHCDIKPSNIIINKNSKKITIIDFDMSKIGKRVYNSSFGTPDFIAPESIEIGEYSFKSDVWSLGAVFYFILTNKKVTYNSSSSINSITTSSSLNLNNQFKNINLESIHNSIFYNIIYKMLSYDKNIRPSASECLKEFENLSVYRSNNIVLV